MPDYTRPAAKSTAQRHQIGDYLFCIDYFPSYSILPLFRVTLFLDYCRRLTGH